MKIKSCVSEVRFNKQLTALLTWWTATESVAISLCPSALVAQPYLPSPANRYNINRFLQRGGERDRSVDDDVRDWLEEQEDSPRFQMITENDIVASVTNLEKENTSKDEDGVPVKKVKFSTLRIYLDALLDYTTYSTIPETSSHYVPVRMLREITISSSTE